jgi:hypothetical protein
MPSTYSNLKIQLMTQGENNNQWGNITNSNLGTAMEQAIVGMATVSTGFTSNVATLTLTNTNALQDARAVCLNVTATLTGAGTLNVPAIQKPYLIFNNTSGGFALTVKVSGLTGISIPNGKKAFVYNNGTDVGEAINYFSTLSLGTALGIANGGTGQTTQTAAFDALSPTTTKGDLIANNGSDNIRVAVGSDNQVLVADSTQASGVKWAVGPFTSSTITDAATITPSITVSQYSITALAQPATFANPAAGSNGQRLIIRIKDNGTARALTWDTSYRAVGSILPTSTVANKVTYVGMVYNTQDSYWDVVAAVTQS